MADRLRVLLVGVTAADAEALRATAERVFEVTGVAALADVQSGNAMLPDALDAILMTRDAWRRERRPNRVDTALSLVEQLTARERDVLALAADGLSNRDIAMELDISEHTVKFHLASVFGKLGASSRTEAVRRGLELGLIEI